MDALSDAARQLADAVLTEITAGATHRNRWLNAARMHLIEARFAIEKARGEDDDLGRFRASFKTDAEWQAAMDRADELEAQGMRNRAWRVRRNLDELWQDAGN